MAGSEKITELLRAWGGGDPGALDELLSLVYRDLKRLAASRLRGERRGISITPTVLVHEALLRVMDQRDVVWRSRAQFYWIFSEAMRRVLVDRARARLASKRGGRQERITLDEALLPGYQQDAELLDLDQALKELAAKEPRRERVVVLRYFGGFSEDEAAAALGVSVATVKREWALARPWLFRRLKARSA